MGPPRISPQDLILCAVLLHDCLLTWILVLELYVFPPSGAGRRDGEL